MAAFQGVLHQLHAGLELCAAAGVALVVEARVAADLPQLGELGQNLQLVALEVVGQLVGDLQGKAVLACLVELGLLTLHLGKHHALALLGQVGEHVALEAAQDERGHEAAQLVGRPFLAGLDRALEALGKVLAAAQDPRHQEVKDAPELGGAVLNGGAGEGQAHGCHQALGRLGHLGPGVLDVLGLVEDHAREPRLGVLGHVALHKVVGGHEHVALGRPGDRHAARGLGPRHGGNLELRCKPLEFGDPVVDERGRRHHERGARVARLLAGHDVRDGLEGLAQAHVVGQDSAEPQALQGLQPAEALDLVGAQHLAQAGGDLEVGVAEGLEVAHDGAKAAVALQPHPVGLLEQRVHKERAARGQPAHAAGQLLGAHVETVGQVVERADAPVELENVSVRKPQVALLAPVGFQVGGQVAGGHAAGVHGQVEQAPVDRGLDAHLGALAHAHGAQPLAEQHLAEARQLPQPLGEQEVEQLVVALVEVGQFPGLRRRPVRGGSGGRGCGRGRCGGQAREVGLHNVLRLVLEHRVARGLAGALGGEQIELALAVAHRGAAGHQAVVEPHLEGELGGGRQQGVEVARRVEVGARAQHRQRRATERREVAGADVERAGAGQKRGEQRGGLGRELLVAAPGLLLAQQVEALLRRKAAQVRRQREVEATVAGGGKDRRHARVRGRDRQGARGLGRVVAAEIEGELGALEHVEDLDGVGLGEGQLLDVGPAAGAPVVVARHKESLLAVHHAGHHGEQPAGPRREGLGHMGKGEVLAVGELGTLLPSLHERGDVLDHIGRLAAAHPELERQGLGSPLVDGRGGGGDGHEELDGLFERLPDGRAGTLRCGGGPDALGGDGAQEVGDLGARGRCGGFGRGWGEARGAGGARRRDAGRRAAAQVGKGQGDLVLAHAVVVHRGRAGALVGDHVLVVEVERDRGAVAADARALHEAREPHDAVDLARRGLAREYAAVVGEALGLGEGGVEGGFGL